MRKKEIKTTFSKFSEILPKEINYNWELFSKDPFHPFLWNVLIGIINYLPDGVELPTINSDFDPLYEDPKKLEYMEINNCWRLRMWWFFLERWKAYSFDDLSIELQKEMLVQEPEAKRIVAELDLWEGIYSSLDNPQDLPCPIGADDWQRMQLEGKKSNFSDKSNIEDYKQELREILKYLNCSRSSKINPCSKEKYPIYHEMLRLAHSISTQDSEIRNEFITSYLNPYLNSVRFILKCLRAGILLPGETEVTKYRHSKISGGIQYIYVDGKPVVAFRQKKKKKNISGRGRKPQKS